MQEFLQGSWSPQIALVALIAISIAIRLIFGVRGADSGDAGGFFSFGDGDGDGGGCGGD
jgi:hypothetical protein